MSVIEPTTISEVGQIELHNIGGAVGGINGFTWDGEYFWLVRTHPGRLYKIATSGYPETYYDATNEDDYFYDVTYDGENLWLGYKRDSAYWIGKIDMQTMTMESSFSPCSGFITLAWDGEYLWLGCGNGQHDSTLYYLRVKESTTTTTIPPPDTTTTTTEDSTTTTTRDDSCPTELIYGEHSEGVELLRYFRDNALSKSPEGREIIRLYYELNPAIVKAMQEGEEFKAEIKEMVDEVLELITEEAE